MKTKRRVSSHRNSLAGFAAVQAETLVFCSCYNLVPSVVKANAGDMLRNGRRRPIPG